MEVCALCAMKSHSQCFIFTIAFVEEEPFRATDSAHCWSVGCRHIVQNYLCKSDSLYRRNQHQRRAHLCSANDRFDFIKLFIYDFIRLRRLRSTHNWNCFSTQRGHTTCNTHHTSSYSRTAADLSPVWIISASKRIRSFEIGWFIVLPQTETRNYSENSLRILHWLTCRQWLGRRTKAPFTQFCFFFVFIEQFIR